MHRDTRGHTQQTGLLQIRMQVLTQLLAFSLLLSSTQAAQFPIPGGVYLTPRAYTENVPHSGNILQVSCTDSGGTPLGTNAAYSITGGNSQPFTINSTSGEISWSGTQSLDYEATPFLLFDIMCEDVRDRSNTATAQVNVSVGPVNEFIPTISPSTILVNIAENAAEGTILASTQPGGRRQYTVNDRDDGPDGVITYTLSNASDSEVLDGLLTVDRETGALALTRQLDVDNIQRPFSFLSVLITACDRGRPRNECPDLRVTVIVQRAADNDPMFSENQYTVALAEDAPIGSTIATTMCSDQDSGAGAYGGIDIVNTIPSSAEDVFRLDSSPAEGKTGSGGLVLQGQLDYETARLYNVTLRCYDNQLSPREDLVQVVVIVVPVNDEPPVFENSFYSFAVNRISASGADIGQIVAVDSDQEVGGEIAYSIFSGDTDNFGVRLDGMVYLKDFVFAFEGDSFDLVVMASDGKFNATTEVIITVSGFLSIPEIVIVILSAVVFILFIVVVVVIVCICCYCRCLPSKGTPSSPSLNFKGDMTDGQHEFDSVLPHHYTAVPYPVHVPVPVPMPAQYEAVPGAGPLLSVSQNPRWGTGSMESLTSANDEVDQTSIPPSPGIGPVLHEVVEHFKEGDKAMGIKQKKTSKSEKE